MDDNTKKVIAGSLAGVALAGAIAGGATLLSDNGDVAVDPTPTPIVEESPSTSSAPNQIVIPSASPSEEPVIIEWPESMPSYDAGQGQEEPELPPFPSQDPNYSVTDYDVAASVISLREAVIRLEEKARERGMSLEEVEAGQTVGLNAIIDGLDGMAPIKGNTTEEKVSLEGTITLGDYVYKAWQFTSESSVRFATQGVKILASCSQDDQPGVSTGNNYGFGILFTQDGVTKLRVGYVYHGGGNIGLGNTVQVADHEIGSAAMRMDRFGSIYIAYNDDGDGILTVYSVPNTSYNRVASVRISSEIWLDGDEPENICMDVIAKSNTQACITICCTRLPEGSIDEDERYAVVVDMDVDGSYVALYPEVPLTPEANPVLTGINYSNDTYDSAWALCQVGVDEGWTPYTDTYPFTCAGLFITYPRANETSRGIIGLYRPVGGPSQVKCYQVCNVIDSLPSVAMNQVMGEYEVHAPGYVALAHGVTHTYLNDQNEVDFIKSYPMVELYAGTREDCTPWKISQVSTRSRYNQAISRLSVEEVVGLRYMVGFSLEDTMYLAIVDMNENDPVHPKMGPTMNVCTFHEYAKAHCTKSGRALVVYQTDAGDGYVKLYRQESVVVETTAERAEGVALKSGATGENINVAWAK